MLFEGQSERSAGKFAVKVCAAVNGALPLRFDICAQLEAFGAAKTDEARKAAVARNAHAVAAAGLQYAVADLGGYSRAALGVDTRHPRTCIDYQS